MRLLVTGGAGYIGGSVAIQLMEAGHEVTVLDSLVRSRIEYVPKGARFVEADVADRARVEPLLRELRPDGVLHFAAFLEAGESMQKPEIYFRNNTASTLALLEAMHATATDRLVFSSTAAVYGEPEHELVEETDRLEPTNAYGESKLLSERIIEWFHRVHGLRYASLRYFNVAGSIGSHGEAHEPESHLVPRILDVALGRVPFLNIFGEDYDTPDGTCVRDYIHVADLAEAHVLALHALGKQQRIVCNLGNGNGFSVKEVVESVRRVTKHPIPVKPHARRPGDPARLVASSARAFELLGWKPKHPAIDDIIASAWAWHPERYKLPPKQHTH
jgi:UDP-glucose 4-epimerase